MYIVEFSKVLSVVALAPETAINIGLLSSSKSAICIVPEVTFCPAINEPVAKVEYLFNIVAIENTCATVASE